jgi:cytochrome c oxidase subunit 3
MMEERTARHSVIPEDPLVRHEASKLGIWTFLATEVLLFGGLFTAYTVFKLKYPDLFYEQHMKMNKVIGAVNTVVLICSSLTVALGIAGIRRGKVAMLKACLIATIALGGVFLCVKYIEWNEHFREGMYPSTNIYFSLYYMMTGLHGIHVLAGMAALSVMLVMAVKGRFSGEYSTPVEVTGVYWHFVDLVWIYLFPMLYLIG